MQVFGNLWGGEGYLTAAMLLSMTSMGMFNDIKNTEIIYRCLDYADTSRDVQRQNDIYNSHQKYYKHIFGCDSIIKCDGMKISNIAQVPAATPDLKQKFKKPGYLAAGCSESDMSTDIRKGIYGKPWVGEAYHSDSQFDRLYANADGNIVIINCGGYKGGGTAATFIPLENSIHAEQDNPNVTSAKRFSVIAGPSTTFYHTTKINNVGIYSGIRLNNVSNDGTVDLFCIPQVLEGLNRLTPAMSANLDIHRENIAALEREYEEKIYCPAQNRDYRNLTPSAYMSRFIDRIRSDDTLSQVDASFINIKPNLRREGDSFNYDVTGKRFEPDNQMHDLHITNLINAVTIQELAINSDKYGGNAIYTFCSPNTNKFTVECIFRPEDAKKFYRFIIFSIILVKYVYSYFSNINQPGADVMLCKWACERNFGLLNLKWVIALDNDSDEGRHNNLFANGVRDTIAEFAWEYILPVLKAFMDIQKTSDDVDFFSKTTIGNFNNGINEIIGNLSGKIHKDNNNFMIDAIDSPNTIKEETERNIAAILTGKNGFSNDFNTVLQTIQGQIGEGNDFLGKYQADFLSFDKCKSGRHRVWVDGLNNNDAVAAAAKDYCYKIIKYTYDKISDTLI